MAEDPHPHKIPLVFYRTLGGSKPVREWLKELDPIERHAIGGDLLRTQWRWPVGMPLCRALRVLICFAHGHLVALHGLIKKTRETPREDLVIARTRQKELEG